MKHILISVSVLASIILISVIVSCRNNVESYEDFFKKGKTEFYNQNYEAAIELFSQTVKIMPKHSGAYAYRGDSYFKCGKISKALIDYDNSLKYNPKYVRALYGKATVKFYIGDYLNSIIDLNKTIAANKNHLDAHNKRGLAKFQIGDFYGALEDFEQLIKLDSTFAEAYYNKAITLFELSDTAEACLYLYRANYYGFKDSLYLDKKICSKYWKSFVKN